MDISCLMVCKRFLDWLIDVGKEACQIRPSCLFIAALDTGTGALNLVLAA